MLLTSTAVERGYVGSGGENGVILERDRVPASFRTLDQTQNIYWAAMALLGPVLTAAVVLFPQRSVGGVRRGLVRLRRRRVTRQGASGSAPITYSDELGQRSSGQNPERKQQQSTPAE